MGRRFPINPTPEQAMTVLLLVATIAAVLVAVAVLELVITRGAALAVRLSGRKPPPHCPTRVALDELEDRLRRRSE